MLSRNGRGNPPTTTTISAHVGMTEHAAEAAGFNYQSAMLWFLKHLLGHGESLMQVAFKALALEIKTCHSVGQLTAHVLR